MTSFARPIISCAAAAAALFAVALVAGGETLAQDTSQPPAAAPAPSAAPVIPPQPPPVERPGVLHQLKGWWDDSMAAIDTRTKGLFGKPDDSGTKPSDSGKAAADAGNNPAMDAATDVAKGAAAVTQDAMKGAVEATKGAATTATDAMKGAVEATKGAATTATDAMKGAVEVTKNAATAIVRLPTARVIDLHETCIKAPNGGSDCAAAAANGCRAKGFSGGSPLDVRTAEKCDTKPAQAGNLSRPLACASEAVVIRAVCQ